MQIRILTSFASPTTAYRRGQMVPNLPDETARDWIAHGLAEEIREQPVELALAPAYETTAKRTSPRKGR